MGSDSMSSSESCKGPQAPIHDKTNLAWQRILLYSALVGIALGQRSLLCVFVPALPAMQWHDAVLLHDRSLHLSCCDMLCIAGLGLLARACLLLRLEDARAGLLYSQYHGILAACTAEHEM